MKFLTDQKQVVEDLNKGLRKCFDKIREFDERSDELMRLMKIAEDKCFEEYEAMELNLVKHLKQDK